MRALRWLLSAAVVGSVLLLPSGAAANGGSFLSFDRSHYLPGDPAEAVGSVFIPPARQGVLERGPFYGFLLPPGTPMREGEPIPDAAITLGAFFIEAGGDDRFELRLSFTVPEVPGDFYTIALCNRPCTVSGFREPLIGTLSVVATAREAALIERQWRLQGRVFTLRERLEKAELRIIGLESLAGHYRDRAAGLTEEIERVERELNEAKAASEVATRTPPSRSALDVVASLVVACSVLALAALAAFRRRRTAADEAIGDLEGAVKATSRR